MNKKELREHVRQLQNNYSPEQLHHMSQRITQPLANYIIKKDGINTILLYHSLPDEVDTHTLIQQLLTAGKQIILPTVVDNHIELHQHTLHTPLHTGYKGIAETSGPPFTNYTQLDLAIIPGRAFTKTGQRLGRGKGYYDRLLPQLTCPLIGLAFPFQIQTHIPTCPHDIPMHYVIS